MPEYSANASKNLAVWRRTPTPVATTPPPRRWFPQGEKCELCSRFLERRSGRRVAGKLAKWPLVVWRAGWRDRQDAGGVAGGPGGNPFLVGGICFAW